MICNTLGVVLGPTAFVARTTGHCWAYKNHFLVLNFPLYLGIWNVSQSSSHKKWGLSCLLKETVHIMVLLLSSEKIQTILYFYWLNKEIGFNSGIVLIMKQCL